MPLGRLEQKQMGRLEQKKKGVGSLLRTDTPRQVNFNRVQNVPFVSTREREGFPFPDYPTSRPGEHLRADLNFQTIGGVPREADIEMVLVSPSGKKIRQPQSKEIFKQPKTNYGLETVIPKDAESGEWEVFVTINGKEVQDTKRKHTVGGDATVDPLERYRESSQTQRGSPFAAVGEPVQKALSSILARFESQLPTVKGPFSGREIKLDPTGVVAFTKQIPKIGASLAKQLTDAFKNFRSTEELAESAIKAVRSTQELAEQGIRLTREEEALKAVLSAAEAKPLRESVFGGLQRAKTARELDAQTTKALSEFFKQAKGATGIRPTISRAAEAATQGTKGMREIIEEAPRIEQRAFEAIPEFKTAEGIAQLQSRTRGVVSDEAARQAMINQGMTEERVLRMPVGTIMSKEQKFAVQGVVQNSIDTLRAMERGYAELADEVAKAAMKMELAQQKLKTMRLLTVERGIASETGRALQAHKATIEGLTLEEQRLSKVLADPKTPQEVKDYISEQIAKFAGEPEKLRELAQSLHQASLMEMFVEFATAIKLYAIPTHLVNTLTSIGRLTINIPLRAMSGALDALESAITGVSRERFISEFKNESVGQWMGWRTSWRNALRALKDENYALEAQKIRDFSPTGAAIKGRVGKNERIDRFLNVFGKGVRVSFRMLGVEDTLIRGPAEMGEMFVQVGRAALQKGFKPGSKEYNDYIAKAILEPNTQVLDEVAAAGSKVLFQEKLTPAMQKVNEVRSQLPVTKFVVPFFRTLNNLIRQAIEFSPVAPILPSVRKGLAVKGARADAIAKMALGTSVMAPLTMYALEDNITLSAPQNAAERDAFYASGKQPYAIKVGDKWYSYQRFSPFAEWFVTAGILAELHKNEDEKGMGELLADSFFTLSRNMLDKTFVSGLNDFLEALTNPNKAESFLHQTITGATIPTIVSRAATSIDPTIREVDSLREAYMAKTPWLSRKLPARMDVFGEDLLRPGGAISRFVSPMVVTSVKVDVVRNELEEVGYKMGFPAQTAFGFEITDEQYRELKQISGQVTYAVLFNVVTSEEYQNLSVRDKEKFVSTVVSRTREKVREAVAGEQLLLSEIKNRLKQRGFPDEQAEKLAEEVYEKSKQPTQ